MTVWPLKGNLRADSNSRRLSMQFIAASWSINSLHHSGEDVCLRGERAEYWPLQPSPMLREPCSTSSQATHWLWLCCSSSYSTCWHMQCCPVRACAAGVYRIRSVCLHRSECCLKDDSLLLRSSMSIQALQQSVHQTSVTVYKLHPSWVQSSNPERRDSLRLHEQYGERCNALVSV